MKNPITRFLLTSALAMAVLVPSAPANDDEFMASMKAIAGAFMDKARSGAIREADYADELLQLDQFLASQQDNPEHAAEVLSFKAIVYSEILGDNERALALLETIGTDYPGTQAAENSVEVIAFFKQKEQSERMRKSLVVGATFPEFSVKDLDGNDLSLSDFQGNVVLVDFWATWCAPCLAELPTLMAAYEKFHEDGFEIIGISLDEDRAALEAFLEKRKITWPQYFDSQAWGSELARKYGVEAIPTSYLLSKQGKIIGVDLRGRDLGEALAIAFGR
jgi:peroxiredoxin